MRQISIFVLLSTIGCVALAEDLTLSDTLHTTVRGRNIQDVAHDVQQWHDTQYPDCKYVRTLGAEVFNNGPQGAVEHWTIEACKHQHFTYRVLVLPAVNGTISDSVGNIDGSPVTRHQGQ